MFGLVLHTEGLANDGVVKTLEEFGKGLYGSFRPLLAVITPLCPKYHSFSSAPGKRVMPSLGSGMSKSESDFREKIQRLSAYYDIGYHGHFFRVSEGRYRPAFDAETLSQQATRECKFLSQIGFRPQTYAGGWWHISRELVSILQSLGFDSDTTVNDLRLDSFSRPQPFAADVGKPFWLTRDIVEIPSVRSVASLAYMALQKHQLRRFAVIAPHDYDFPSSSLAVAIQRLVWKLVREDRVLSIPDLVKEAKRWLDSNE